MISDKSRIFHGRATAIIILLICCVSLTFGFSCYICSSDNNREGDVDLCLNQTERYKGKCPRRSNICKVTLITTPLSNEKILDRQCDSTRHAHLCNGCSKSLTVFNETLITCVCSKENCNGKSILELETAELRPEEELLCGSSVLTSEFNIIIIMLGMSLA